MRRRTWLAIAGLAIVVAAATRADWRTPLRGEGPETAPVQRIDERPYVGVNDLGRLLDATKFWRGDLRRMVLRRGLHSITLVAENPFVMVDDLTVWLAEPVREAGGELHVPVSLVDSLPFDSTLVRLFYDRRRERIVVLPPSGGVGTPRATFSSQQTRLVFPADRADEAAVVTRDRRHFRIRFGGMFTGVLPDSFPSGSLVRAIRPIAVAGGSAFECEIDDRATGFRLIQEAGARRVTLELASSGGPQIEAFAPEAAPGPRRLNVIVLDPGHGGTDAGVTDRGAVEKNLTLALARMLKSDLERRLAARVILTRTDDRAVTPEARAEIANRARADLVLTLHFDGFAHADARGATGYCPPATYAAPGGRGDRSGARGIGDFRSAAPLTLLPWRDVASRHAVQSRALAEAVLSALELRGLGPTRLRERLPFGLLGVNAPGILLECATLTAPSDHERVIQQEGLRELSISIAEGVAAYQRNP